MRGQLLNQWAASYPMCAFIGRVFLDTVTHKKGLLRQQKAQWSK
jgi:hypothetical protein